MKLASPSLLLLAPLAFALVPSALFSEPLSERISERISERSSAEDAQESEAHVESALEESMGKLNRGLRELRGVLKDPAAMRAKVEDVAGLQRLLLEAKELLPHKVEALEDEAAKSAEIAAYRTEMNAAVRGLLDVEDAFLAGDGDTAKEALQSLEKLKRDAHDRFQERKPRGR